MSLGGSNAFDIPSSGQQSDLAHHGAADGSPLRVRLALEAAQLQGMPTAPTQPVGEVGAAGEKGLAEFSAPTQQAIGLANRFTPGSSGEMSRSEVDGLVPQRGEAPLVHESPLTVDYKNAIAALFRPNQATAENGNAPYETVRMDRVEGHERPAVGRYGLTSQHMRHWFSTMFGGDGQIADDNIADKMDKLAVAGKVPNEYAARFHDEQFAHRFVSLMRQMRDGVLPTQADVRDLIPPHLQEQVAADLVSRYIQVAGSNATKGALAFHLGKSPEHMSRQEIEDPGNQNYLQAVQKFAQLAHGRSMMAKNDKLHYTVSPNGTNLDTKIIQSSLHTARRMQAEGHTTDCALGVQLAWAKAGYRELLGTGDGWKMHYALDRDPKFVCVDRATAFDAVRRGHAAIVTRQWSHSPNGSGHIETLIADNRGGIMGASDFTAPHVVQNGRYDWHRDRFYLPRATVMASRFGNPDQTEA